MYHTSHLTKGEELSTKNQYLINKNLPPTGGTYSENLEEICLAQLPTLLAEINKKQLKKSVKKRTSYKNGTIDEGLIMKYMGRRLQDQKKTKERNQSSTAGHEIKFSGMIDQKKSSKTQTMISDFG